MDSSWIILGVLIGIAILSTVGYFYWSGTEDYMEELKYRNKAVRDITVKKMATHSNPKKVRAWRKRNDISRW